MTTGEAVSLGRSTSLGGGLSRALLLSEIQITAKAHAPLQYPCLSVCLSSSVHIHPA